MKYQLYFENKVTYQSFGRYLMIKHYYLFKKLKCENQTLMTNSEKIFKEVEKLSQKFVI